MCDSTCRKPAITFTTGHGQLAGSLNLVAGLISFFEETRIDFLSGCRGVEGDLKGSQLQSWSVDLGRREGR
jgi:hypothetical protein